MSSNVSEKTLKQWGEPVEALSSLCVLESINFRDIIELARKKFSPKSNPRNELNAGGRGEGIILKQFSW